MRYLFTSAQLPGHLDWGGFLKSASELQRRGHDLLWVSGQAVKPILERARVPHRILHETGWRWPPPPPLPPDLKVDAVEQRRQKAARALDQWLDVGRVELATTELVRIARDFQPDVIVSENFISAAPLAAEVIDVPLVVAGWPALQAKATDKSAVIVDLARTRLNRLLDHFKIRGVNWSQTGAPAPRSPSLHLTYWSERWYNGMALLPQTQHVGGCAEEPAPLTSTDPVYRLLNDPSLADEVWVFITLGTSFGDDPNFFVAASHAAAQVGALPILAIGQPLSPAAQQQMRARLPRNAVVLPPVPLAALLPTVGAAIHHGGAGTTHALVTHAVPHIIVPHAADQMHQAHGVTRCGVGAGVRPRDVTIDGLAHLLEEMLSADSHYQRAAQRLQGEFAQLGGIARAADLLESVLRAA